jgi:hypothetical protein
MKPRKKHATVRRRPVVQPHASASVSPATLPVADINLVGGVRLSKWRKAVGLSRTSVWRLTKSGRLPVVKRYGVAFLEAQTVKDFFTRESSTPRIRGDTV